MRFLGQASKRSLKSGAILAILALGSLVLALAPSAWADCLPGVCAPAPSTPSPLPTAVPTDPGGQVGGVVGQAQQTVGGAVGQINGTVNGIVHPGGGGPGGGGGTGGGGPGAGVGSSSTHPGASNPDAGTGAVNSNGNSSGGSNGSHGNAGSRQGHSTQGLLGRVGSQAVRAARQLTFPIALIVLALLFAAAQNRIDRNDPKLALAPIGPDVLRFE